MEKPFDDGCNSPQTDLMVANRETETTSTVKPFLNLSRCTFRPNSLTIDSGISFEHWDLIGKTLKLIGGSIQFWLGDWLNHGELVYGEMYAQALETTDYEYQTLKDAKWVAGKIELSLRNDNLTFNHHKEVAKLSPEQQEHWLDTAEAEGWSVRELRKAIQDSNRQGSPPLPEGVYDVIYADPPWKYEFSETESRAIESHYQTMELDEIKALEIPTADNAALFLWATAPKLEEALEVLNAWGFTYRTNMVWDKEKMGMGYWCRGQHELLLIGVKGDFPRPAPENRPVSVIQYPRTKHSKKPECVYDIIELMFPTGAFLELFSRNEREGWTMWGLECEPANEAGAQTNIWEKEDEHK